VEESPESVVITVRVVSTSVSTDLGVPHDIEVVLDGPLGDLAVLDHDRGPVPQQPG
jgi:hypothetical protein